VAALKGGDKNNFVSAALGIFLYIRMDPINTKSIQSGMLTENGVSSVEFKWAFFLRKNVNVRGVCLSASVSLALDGI
jgi:hypothetical protein